MVSDEFVAAPLIEDDLLTFKAQLIHSSQSLLKALTAYSILIINFLFSDAFTGFMGSSLLFTCIIIML